RGAGCTINSVLATADSGTPTNFPTPGATGSWDCASGQAGNRVWLYGWSTANANTMLRLGATVSNITSPFVTMDGAVTTDDTAVGSGTNTDIRVVKEPTAPLFTDWQTYQSTT